MRLIEILEDSGVGRIALERLRQVTHEGWNADHDDQHQAGQLAMAGACYAAPKQILVESRSSKGASFTDPWPWADKWDKRGNGDRIRDLEKAGALIAAEIDRLLRGGEVEKDGG